MVGRVALATVLSQVSSVFHGLTFLEGNLNNCVDVGDCTSVIEYIGSLRRSLQDKFDPRKFKLLKLQSNTLNLDSHREPNIEE